MKQRSNNRHEIGAKRRDRSTHESSEVAAHASVHFEKHIKVNAFPAFCASAFQKNI